MVIEVVCYKILLILDYIKHIGLKYYFSSSLLKSLNESCFSQKKMVEIVSGHVGNLQLYLKIRF